MLAFGLLSQRRTQFRRGDRLCNSQDQAAQADHDKRTAGNDHEPEAKADSNNLALRPEDLP